MPRINKENDYEAFQELLTEIENANLSLDEAIRDYGRWFEGTSCEQAYHDFMDARTSIKRTLQKFAKENDLENVLDLID